jgi:hypothetical protein
MLVEGERLPKNGMEKHFLNVIKGKSSPCTAEEKRWHNWWLAYSTQKNNGAVDVKILIPPLEQAIKSRDKAPAKKKKAPAKKKYGSAKDRQARQRAYELAKARERARYNQPKEMQKTLSLNDERMLKEKKARISMEAKIGPKPKPNPISKKELLVLKYKGPTSYKVNEGIGGTREDNKKMKAGLFGDMQSRLKE